MLLWLLYGCGTSTVQEAQKLYQEGRYVEASESAMRALKNPQLQEEANQFLMANGETLINKAIQKGLELEAATTNYEEAIRYFQALKQLGLQIESQQIPVPHIQQLNNQIYDQTEQVIKKQAESQYVQGRLAFEAMQYRSSFMCFKKVNQVRTEYHDTVNWLRRAFQYAQRNIGIAPMYKKTDAATEQVNEALSKVFSTKKNEKLKIPLIVYNINLTEALSKAIIENANQKKSPFFKWYLFDDITSQSAVHYGINGTIDAQIISEETEPIRARVQDVLQYSVKNGDKFEWKEAPLEYDVFSTRLVFKIIIDGAMMIPSTNQQVAEIKLDKTYQKETAFRSKPVSIPQEAINLKFPSRYLGLKTQPERMDEAEIISSALNDIAGALIEQVQAQLDAEPDAYSWAMFKTATQSQ